MKLKGQERKPIYKHGLTKKTGIATKYLGYDSCFPGWDPNQRPLEYDVEVLTAQTDIWYL
jgi:hypothetical protein